MGCIFFRGWVGCGRIDESIVVMVVFGGDCDGKLLLDVFLWEVVVD